MTAEERRIAKLERAVRAAVAEIERGRAWEAAQRLRRAVQCKPPIYNLATAEG